MGSARITPELSAEMSALRKAGRAEARLAVVIAVEPPAESAGARDVEAMAAAIRAAQEPVVRRLAQLGVTRLRRQAIASAVEAELTPAQIEAVADEPTVRRLMLDRVVKVTAEHQWQ